MQHFLFLLKGMAPFNALFAQSAGNIVANPGYFTDVFSGERADVFWHRFTVSFPDGAEPDLRGTAERLLLAVRLLHSDGILFNPIIIIPCSEDAPFAGDTPARLFFNHYQNPGLENQARGLRGAGGHERHVVLRLAQNRAVGTPDYRSLPYVVGGRDLTFTPETAWRHGALGLRTDSDLGLFYWPLAQVIFGSIEGLEDTAAFDTNGVARALSAKNGLPVLNIASLLNKKKAQSERMHNDEKLFHRYLHGMLETSMKILEEYRLSYWNFNFKWADNELPGGNLIAEFDSTHQIKRIAPIWVEHLRLLRREWRSWSTLLGYTFGPDGVTKISVPQHLRFGGHVEVLEQILTYFWQFEQWQDGALQDTTSDLVITIGDPSFMIDGVQQFWTTFAPRGAHWYEIWPQLEGWLFGLVQRVCLLQSVAYLLPMARARGAEARKLLYRPTIEDVAPVIPDTITVQLPPFWETQRIGRGPFLSSDTNTTAIWLGPWNPTTDPVLPQYYNFFYVAGLWAGWNGNIEGVKDAIHNLKHLYLIADPQQQKTIRYQMNVLIFRSFAGNDPLPDEPPNLGTL